MIVFFCCIFEIQKRKVMKKYTDVFFDLDRTLWDFDTNSRASVDDLIDKYDLLSKGIPSKDEFFQVYTAINNILWERYRKGSIAKAELKVLRYEKVLRHFGIFNHEMAEIFGREYLEILVTKKNVFPGTHKILEYLKPKYRMHIITNGFEEVQDKKMNTAGLTDFFEVVITSEAAGVRKPNPGIFEFALAKTNANVESSIMIGDDLPVDILGAKDFGMDQIYFNPGKKKHSEAITYEVAQLSDIASIL